MGKAHSVLAFSCCSLPTRPSSPAPVLLVLPGGSSRCWQHLLAPKRGKPSHEPLAPMGRGRCGMETPTQEAASLAATSWRGEQGSGGARRGGVESPRVPGEVAEVGMSLGGPCGAGTRGWGLPVAPWSRPFPSSSLLGWGPRGGWEAPQVCPASVSALWVLWGARPPQRVM